MEGKKSPTSNGDRRSLLAGFLGGALSVAALGIIILLLFPAISPSGALLSSSSCPGVASGGFLSASALFGGPRASASCNLVQPIFSPGTNEELVSLIRSARTSIDVEMYVFTDENLARELTEASARGVKVRVILEPRVSASNLNAIAAGLQAGGVSVKWASVRYQLTHTKMMIVDGKEALVGSINFSKAAQNKNREAAVVLEGPALADLQKIFEQDFKDGTMARPLTASYGGE